MTAHATSQTKQFTDDVEALKEFDEGDEFVCKLQEDLRKFFCSHAEVFCTLDLSVIRARF